MVRQPGQPLMRLPYGGFFAVLRGMRGGARVNFASSSHLFGPIALKDVWQPHKAPLTRRIVEADLGGAAGGPTTNRRSRSQR